MAYSDNYPNGHKSGYNSWDDPDRTISSPRVGVPRSSGIIEESEYDKRRKEERQRQVEREMIENQKIEDRKIANARRDKEYEAASILKHEVFADYNKQNWLRRFVDKRKGKDPYSRQDEITKQAYEQVSAMSDRELDDFINRGGRIR